MDFISFFENVWANNAIMCLVAFYLTFNCFFGAQFVNCVTLDRPLLLKSFNAFSVYFLFLLISYFSLDFGVDNKICVFDQTVQFNFLIFLIFIIFCSADFLKSKQIFNFEYDLLVSFVIMASLCICFCNDFISFYLALELQSLAFYVLASFNRNSEFSVEAGLKYFVFGGFMSCFFLIGLCFLYLMFGSLNFEFLASILNECYQLPLTVGFFFILMVLLFKIGAVPFHFWICDVYEGSILPITLLFAAGSKIVLYAVLLKIVFFMLFNYENVWSFLLMLSSVSSIILGSIAAIFQKRLKRLFAFSTIAHAGFILLAFLSASIDTPKSLLFYLIIYSFVSICLFAILINVSAVKTIMPKYLVNFAGIGSKNFVFAGCFAFVILSIAGIPPLAGFFSKFLVIFSIVKSGYFFVAFVVVSFSSLACFYYIRLVKILFFVERIKINLWITSYKQNTEFVIFLFLFFILFFYMWPNLILNFTAFSSFAFF